MACGGYGLPESCYEYNPLNDAWFLGPATFDVFRIGSASVELTDGTFWVLSGNTTDAQDSSELFVDNRFVEGPSLEGLDTTDNMCAVAIDERYTFFAGATAYIYDWTSEQWEDISNGWDFTARDAMCGMYSTDNGAKHIVVAGGDNFPQDKTKILDLATMAWRPGPNLPEPITAGRALQDGEATFLIFGGWSVHSGSMSSIIEFNPSDESWFVREETMASRRHDSFVIDVDNPFFCS